MKIWVDLSTPPQVLFLQPIIAELEKRGHEVFITTRDFNETIRLADSHGLAHMPIGVHGGKTVWGKLAANLARGRDLRRIFSSQHISLAVSQGSIGQAIAAFQLRIPMVSLDDYEGQPGNHIVCRVAKRIIVPNAFKKANLRRFGATESKIISYAGIKEQVYLATFEPDDCFREKMGIEENAIVATMRPPSVVSAYHHFENTVFNETINYVAGHENTIIVLLPRGEQQRQEYARYRFPNLIMPEEVLDGPKLVYASDLVIGAGGTMNREATVLGTPVYTQFQGLKPSVDDYLIGEGKMIRIVDKADIPNIKVCKKPFLTLELWKQGAGLAGQIVDLVLA